MQSAATPTFTAQVRVDQGNAANPIQIVTEPPIEGRPLAEMVGWLQDVRADLKSGEYVITLGAAEDGIQGTGPDQRTVDTLRRRLHEPMADIQEDVTEAYAWNGLDDAAFVQQMVDASVSGITPIFGRMKPESMKPGFVEFRVGCPNCGPALGLLEANLGELAELETSPEEAEDRGFVLGIFDRLFGITPKKPKGAILTFVPGAAHGNAFEKPANAKLQARIDRLQPQIEAGIAAKLAEYVDGSRGRADAFSAALRENFNKS